MHIFLISSKLFSLMTTQMFEKIFSFQRPTSHLSFHLDEASFLRNTIFFLFAISTVNSFPLHTQTAFHGKHWNRSGGSPHSIVLFANISCITIVSSMGTPTLRREETSWQHFWFHYICLESWERQRKCSVLELQWGEMIRKARSEINNLGKKIWGGKPMGGSGLTSRRQFLCGKSQWRSFNTWDLIRQCTRFKDLKLLA